MHPCRTAGGLLLLFLFLLRFHCGLLLFFASLRVRILQVLLLGIAYKPNIDDIRETPAFILWELLLKEASYTTATVLRHTGSVRPAAEYSRVLPGGELSERGEPPHIDGGRVRALCRGRS